MRQPARFSNSQHSHEQRPAVHSGLIGDFFDAGGACRSELMRCTILLPMNLLSTPKEVPSRSWLVRVCASFRAKPVSQRACLPGTCALFLTVEVFASDYSR